MRTWKVQTTQLPEGFSYSPSVLAMVQIDDFGQGLSNDVVVTPVGMINPFSTPVEIEKFFADRVKLAEYYRHGRGKDNRRWIQFALYNETTGNFVPVVWFTVEFDDGEVLYIDKAFDTVLVSKNKVRIPFGRFPIYQKRYPVRRESNIEKRAFKYLRNRFNK